MSSTARRKPSRGSTYTDNTDFDLIYGLYDDRYPDHRILPSQLPSLAPRSITNSAAGQETAGYLDGADDAILKRLARGGTVADRIKWLNTGYSANGSTTSASKAADAAEDKPNRWAFWQRKASGEQPKPGPSSAKPRGTKPKDAGRNNPFVRRDSVASPTYPQASKPAYLPPRARLNEDTFIHSPAPVRHLKVPDVRSPKPSYVLDTSRGEYDPESRGGFGKRKTMNFAQPAARRTSHAAEPTPVYAPAIRKLTSPNRQFRMSEDDYRTLDTEDKRTVRPWKSSDAMRNAGTTTLMERGRKGEYIPVGHKLPTQVDAASPWYVAPAPRAIQAPKIVTPVRSHLRHHAERFARTSEGSVIDEEDLAEDVNPYYWEPEAGSQPRPILKRRSSPEAVETCRQPKHAKSRQQVSNDIEARISKALAAELYGVIDTIIEQHSHSIASAVANIQDGASPSREIRKLSNEVRKTGNAAVFSNPSGIRSNESIVPVREERGRPGKPTGPSTRRERANSIPELMQLVDETAGDLGIELQEGHRAGPGSIADQLSGQGHVEVGPRRQHPSSTSSNGGYSPDSPRPQAKQHPNHAYYPVAESPPMQPPLSDFAPNHGNGRFAGNNLQIPTPPDMYHSAVATPMAAPQTTTSEPRPPLRHGSPSRIVDVNNLNSFHSHRSSARKTRDQLERSPMPLTLTDYFRSPPTEGSPSTEQSEAGTPQADDEESEDGDDELTPEPLNVPPPSPHLAVLDNRCTAEEIYISAQGQAQGQAQPSRSYLPRPSRQSSTKVKQPLRDIVRSSRSPSLQRQIAQVQPLHIKVLHDDDRRELLVDPRKYRVKNVQDEKRRPSIQNLGQASKVSANRFRMMDRSERREAGERDGADDGWGRGRWVY